MPCRCGCTFCIKSIDHCGSCEKVILNTCKMCNKPIYHEQTAIVRMNKELCSCTGKGSVYNERNEEVHKNAKVVDIVETNKFQNKTNQAQCNDQDSLQVLNTIEVNKDECSFKSHANECNASNKADETMIPSIEEVGIVEAAGTSIKGHITQEKHQIVIGTEVSDNASLTEYKSKSWFAVDESKPKRIIPSKFIDAKRVDVPRGIQSKASAENRTNIIHESTSSAKVVADFNQKTESKNSSSVDGNRTNFKLKESNNNAKTVDFRHETEKKYGSPVSEDGATLVIPEMVEKSRQETKNKVEVGTKMIILEKTICAKSVDESRQEFESKCCSLVDKGKTNLKNREQIVDMKVVDNVQMQTNSSSPADGNGIEVVMHETAGDVIEVVDAPKPEHRSQLETASTEHCRFHQVTQISPDDPKVNPFLQEADKDMKAMHKRIRRTVLELKRIKKRIERLHCDIEEFKENKETITKKVTALSSKVSETIKREKLFDKFEKYYRRNRSLIFSVDRLTDEIEDLTNEVQLETNILQESVSKIPELAAQFESMSLDNQNENTNLEVNPKKSSETDMRSIIRKMLKISEKMQKNLIYSNDLLLKSKWELMKVNRGIPKTTNDLYSDSKYS